MCEDFYKVSLKAKRNDFIYFDPPYDNVKDTSFTSYTKTGFSKEDQIRLRDLMIELTKNKVKVMVSNANTPFINEIYKDFNIHIIKAKRSINSNGNNRGKIEEVIITNY